MASARPFDESSKYAAHVPGSMPPRKLNGGLYTGQPFAGPWGNIPIVPDAGLIASSGHFLASHHRVSTPRPGNNAPVPPRMQEIVRYDDISAEFPVAPECRRRR